PGAAASPHCPGGFDARVGMHGGTNPLLEALVMGMRRFTGLPDPAATVRLPLERGTCELRIMARPVFDQSNDVTVYLVEEDFGHLGRAYLETDAAEADRETIVRKFISGQYRNAIRVVAFNTVEAGRAMSPRTSQTRCLIKRMTPTIRSRR